LLNKIAVQLFRPFGTASKFLYRRFQDDPEVKMLVLLGEVGGVEEYKVCEALQSGRIDKPMVAWCIGTCGDMFTTDVQVTLLIGSIRQMRLLFG
jgi:succinyl-CoA synthetase alpha subunit